MIVTLSITVLKSAKMCLVSFMLSAAHMLSVFMVNVIVLNVVARLVSLIYIEKLNGCISISG
jgi:hypothetical protein